MCANRRRPSTPARVSCCAGAPIPRFRRSSNRRGTRPPPVRSGSASSSAGAFPGCKCQRTATAWRRTGRRLRRLAIHWRSALPPATRASVTMRAVLIAASQPPARCPQAGGQRGFDARLRDQQRPGHADRAISRRQPHGHGAEQQRDQGVGCRTPLRASCAVKQELHRIGHQ